MLLQRVLKSTLSPFDDEQLYESIIKSKLWNYYPWMVINVKEKCKILDLLKTMIILKNTSYEEKKMWDIKKEFYIKSEEDEKHNVLRS